MLLKDYVPKFISQSKTMSATYNSEQLEINNTNSSIKDIVNQCFIDTATWGLAYWESFLGITTDLSKDISYRRTVAKSKIRGQGTVTVSMLQNVANSFNNGKVTITEHPSIYSFEVKFSSVIGIPPNLQDLKDALEQIKPAHLVVTYTYSYLLIKDIDQIMTINQLESTLLNKFAGGA